MGYHLARKWRAPDDVNIPRVIGFAVILASFGRDGRRIYPSASKLAETARMHRRNAQKLRTECVRLGLFRDTGQRISKIAVLEIAVPPDAPEDAIQRTELAGIPASQLPEHAGEPGRGCPGCYAFVKDTGNGVGMLAAHFKATGDWPAG
jgi:hypothetical protein